MIENIQKIIELSRLRATEGELSVARQLAEMLILLIFRGVRPGYYHTAGFWRKDLVWEEKTSHLNAREFRRILSRLNPSEYRKITQHKVPEKAILSLFGIATPRFLGQLSQASGCDYAGRSLRNASDLEGLILSSGVKRVVFKKTEGHGGKGVHVVDLFIGSIVRCGSPLSESGEAVSLDRFCQNELRLSDGSTWLIEEYFLQHTTLSVLNPSSVNTIRMWILVRPDMVCEVLTAFLRIGRKQMLVDNRSSGGIVAPIDLASGTLSAARDGTADRRIYRRHPDHGAMVEGVVVPYWKDAQELAKKTLPLFPHMRFAGMDIAVGPNGPVILELNVSPSRRGAAITNYPSKDILNYVNEARESLINCRHER